MTCRHSSNDPNCSNYRGPYGDVDPYEKSWNAHKKECDRQLAAEVERFQKSTSSQPTKVQSEVKSVISETPDSKNYEILEIKEVGRFLVMKLQYPNCSKCAYEGTKILVIESKIIDAVYWKEIDPHFRDEKPTKIKAPSPIARFPASSNGWKNAITFAELISGYNN
jgi:hypothetical protein